jgi:hypothetical protein
LAAERERRSPRIKLQVPVFIRGVDTGGDFLELTKTINISSTGACVVSSHLMRIEQVIQVTIPTPSLSTSELVPPETPPLMARVRRHEISGELHLFGLEFLKPLD